MKPDGAKALARLFRRLDRILHREQMREAKNLIIIKKDNLILYADPDTRTPYYKIIYGFPNHV